MPPKADVWKGTLALMILRTLDMLGPLHGYGVARRIEQTSNQLLAINHGTLYPQLMKLEEDGYITGAWGVSENGQRAKFYRLTRAGRRQLRKGDAGLGSGGRNPGEVPGAGGDKMTRWIRRLINLFRRGRLERELAAELESHLGLETDRNLRAGMDPAEARRVAHARLGGVEQVKERWRAAQLFYWFGSWWLDVKLGLRMLVKYPGLTLVGGLAMAFAICVGIVIFEVATLVVAPTLPLPAGERIVQIRNWDVAANRPRAARAVRLRRLARCAAVGDRARCLEGRQPHPDRRRWRGASRRGR